MMIIGVDYHPSFQQIAFVDTGNWRVWRTAIESQRWRSREVLPGAKAARSQRARGDGGHRIFTLVRAVTGRAGFRGMDRGCGGDQEPSESASRRPTARMRRLLLRLLLENRFPRIWVPSPENRDLRQLLWHRHRLVQMRTRIMNQLQAVAMNEGYRRKKKLWSEAGRAQLEKLPLAPWASPAPARFTGAAGPAEPQDRGVNQQPSSRKPRKRPEVLRLMTHPGVGPITALAFVLIIGTPERFPCGKQIGSYVGLIPSEDSSAGQQRLGHISKQGNSLLRFLLGEAAQAAARCDPDWRRRYVHLAMRRQKKTSPRWPWPEDWRCGCTGCGGTVGNMQNGSSSVRTRDSSVPGHGVN